MFGFVSARFSKKYRPVLFSPRFFKVIWLKKYLASTELTFLVDFTEIMKSATASKVWLYGVKST